MYTQRQKLKRQARKAAIFSSLLLILLILTGTFAWWSFYQRAFNPAWGGFQNFGGRLHDHYSFAVDDLTNRDLLPGNQQHGYRVKNIFAENFLTEASPAEGLPPTDGGPIFARVQLREFLRYTGLGSDPVGYSATNPVDINNPNSWPIFLADADATTGELVRRSGPSYDIGEAGIEWFLGAENYIYYMPTRNHTRFRVDSSTELYLIDPSVPDLFANPHVYRFSEATGQAVDNIATGTVTWDPAPAAPGSVVIDYEEFHVDLLPGVGHASDFATLGVYTGPSTDGRNIWTVGEPHPDGQLIYQLTSNREIRSRALLPGELEARPTKTPTTSIVYDGNTYFFNGIMTIEQWNDWGQPEGNFWILDTTDDNGWFYWNGYINPAEATSLLLDAIYIPEFMGSWEYVITATADFFIYEYIESPQLADMTAAAREIFSEPAAEEPPMSPPLTVGPSLQVNPSMSLSVADFEAMLPDDLEALLTGLTNPQATDSDNLPTGAFTAVVTPAGITMLSPGDVEIYAGATFTITFSLDDYVDEPPVTFTITLY